MIKHTQNSRSGIAHHLSRIAVSLCMGSMSAVVLAAPGNPGVPGPALPIFIETFENRDPATPVALDQYNSGLYTADPYWLNQEQCNGIVYSTANFSPGSPLLNCVDSNNSHHSLSRVATAISLGHRGRGSSTESVLASYTKDVDFPAVAGVVMEMRSAVPVPRNRFVTGGADVGVDNCFSSNAKPPIYTFFLLGNAQTIDLNQPANVSLCKLGRQVSQALSVLFYPVRATRPQITQIDSARLQIRNESTASTGNDAALDNIGIFDVTPQLDHQFARGPLANGAFGINKPARMTLTVTNTDDLLEKDGWGFIETLPANLRVAPTPNLQSNCTVASPVVAVPGSNSIRVVGGNLPNSEAIQSGTFPPLPPTGPTSCTISFDVTSAVAGTYSVTAGSVSSDIGILLPATASVTFENEPVIRLQKALGGSRFQDTDQFLLSIAGGAAGPVQATTEGTGAVVSGPVAVLNPATAGTAYTLSEAPAGSTNAANYASRYSCTNATAGGQTPGGSGTSFSVTPLATDDLTCTFTNNTLVADLQVVKTANVTSLRSGGLVSFSFVATNAGPAPANNAVLRDVPSTGLDCPAASTTATCSATGGAECPSPTVAVSALTGSTGITIPTLPVGGQVTVALQCRVTATGLP